MIRDWPSEESSRRCDRFDVHISTTILPLHIHKGRKREGGIKKEPRIPLHKNSFLSFSQTLSLNKHTTRKKAKKQ
jgi:hypothetical protein